MSDIPNEEMVIRIDYGDGSEPEEHVVTPGFFHFHPFPDDEKYTPTVEVISGGTDEPEPEEDDEDEDESTPVGFDPAAHTVQEVEDHVEANPDQRDDILAAERASKNRVTLIAWLENFTTES